LEGAFPVLSGFFNRVLGENPAQGRVKAGLYEKISTLPTIPAIYGGVIEWCL
jgi:hypothetical protein